MFYMVMRYKDINERHKYMLGNIVLDRSINENTTWLNVISSSHEMLILKIFRPEIAIDSR